MAAAQVGAQTVTQAGEHDLLLRWLDRAAVADAYTRWRGALGTRRAAFLAFAAIAQSSGLLQRVPPEQAAALSRNAILVAYEISLLRKAPPATVAAADLVTERVEAWQWHNRASLRFGAMQPQALPDEAEGDAGGGAIVSIARQALDAFPQVRQSMAAYLFDTLLSLGTAGLIRLGPPMDLVFALGASRVAARSARGAPGYQSFRPAPCLQIIQTVQNWSVQTGLSPFAASDYKGVHGTVLDRVRSLMADAGTCAELAAKLPGSMSAPGYQFWELAEEIHAYVFVAIRNNGMESLEYDKACHIASAAGRLAERAIKDKLIALPTIPNDEDGCGPYTVRAIARSLVNGPFHPRRSGSDGREDAELAN